eukprot:1195335-Prorocentrum_minimum.AAC.9
MFMRLMFNTALLPDVCLRVALSLAVGFSQVSPLIQHDEAAYKWLCDATTPLAPDAAWPGPVDT